MTLNFKSHPIQTLINKLFNPDKNDARLNHVNPGTIKNGIIVLADISGFSNFVRQIDSAIGVRIIHDLLSSIIEENELGLQVNEIEGDAVLFYKVGKPIGMNKIYRQFERMSQKFHQKLESFGAIPENLDLSLKIIMHYGSFRVYHIDGFTKLYGTSIIEAHRLLKNSIKMNHYLLVTEAYLDSLGTSSDSFGAGLQQCDLYEDIGSICYRYLPRSDDKILFL